MTADDDLFHPLQRQAFEAIVQPYLKGQQDGQEWALIDNHTGDDLRYALQAAILVIIAARDELARQIAGRALEQTMLRNAAQRLTDAGLG